uniref:Uncharacterized protein n=1 Tax=Siphoviridae sp. ctxdc10 TaxID=2825740 RepID=A0A8S5TSH8_9CAUD|nr:MAG TPA: hypothetical protein [Siphoviridae sp. ctxdc10]
MFGGANNPAFFIFFCKFKMNCYICNAKQPLEGISETY